MKKLMVLFAMVLFMFSISSDAMAACASSLPLGSFWTHYVAGIPDGEARANISTMLYFYNQNTGTSTWAYNSAWSSNDWFVNDFGLWFTYGNWGNAQVSECPFLMAGDLSVQIVAYDPVAGSDNDVQYAIFGAIWDGTMFNYDNIVSPGGGGIVPLTSIPQPNVTGVVAGAPNLISLSWTDPTTFSYRTAGAPELVAGYEVYYAIVPQGTLPADNAGAWTIVDSGAFTPVGGTATVGVNALPAAGEAMHFALRVVGAGTPVVSPFVTGFTSRASATAWVAGAEDPGAIELISFGAISKNGKAMISWETGSEVNTAGYNVLRSTSPTGRRTVANSALIPAEGGAGVGATYEFIDTNVNAGTTYFYWLEEVENNNDKAIYGSIACTIVSGKISKISSR